MSIHALKPFFGVTVIRCLCKKPCGVNIEVHHLVPENQGGTDDLDNAIPLCFDCHSEVMRYNQEHPRGTKYKQDELRPRREQVYEKFTRHLVPPIGYRITQEVPNVGNRTFPREGTMYYDEAVQLIHGIVGLVYLLVFIVVGCVVALCLIVLAWVAFAALMAVRWSKLLSALRERLGVKPGGPPDPNDPGARWGGGPHGRFF